MVKDNPKRSGLQDLAENTLILASPKFLAFFFRIVTAKLNALFIGAFGVGVVNQIQSVNNQLSNFSVLSLNIGAKKLIVSHYHRDGKWAIPKIVTLFAVVVAAMSLVIYLVGFVFFDTLSTFFLGEEAKKFFLYVFIFFPLIALTAVPVTVLGGLQKFRYLAASEMIVKAVAFLTFLPLIYFFGLPGVVANIILTIVLTFALSYYFMQKKAAKEEGLRLLDWRSIGLPRAMLKDLGLVSGISTGLGVVTIFVELTIRGTLATELGIEQIGLYAPIIAWSGFFSSMFLPALFQYIFPKYGQSQSDKQLGKIANDAFRLLTFIIIPFVLLVISTVHFLLPLLYSREFLGASAYFPLHFVGILFWSWMRILKQLFIPTGRIKQLVPFALAEEILCLGIVLLLVNSIGLWSWALRFSVVPLVLFLAYFIYLSFKISLRISFSNAALMLYGVLSVGVITALREVTSFSVVAAVVLCLLLYFFLRKSEKDYLASRLDKVLSLNRPR